MNTENFNNSSLLIDLISLIIAFIALLLSIGHIIYVLMKKRTNIKLTIDYNDKHTRKTNKYFLVCIISNCSSESVAITGIKLIAENGKEFLSSMSKELVAHYDSRIDKLNTVHKDFVLYSDEMPISFASHSAKRCILCFKGQKENPNIINALVYTSNKTYKSRQITKEFSNAFKLL